MSNEDESIWMTFNGEIYNYTEIRRGLEDRHRFKTRSDTEVILHLYEEKGEKCLEDFRGMFAFGIHDFREIKWLAARDHLGHKPLYYHYDGDRLLRIGIKALLALRPDLAEMDDAALYEYLTLRIIAPPRSMFRKIRKLPPAHFLVFQDGKIAINRYWHLRYEPKRQGDFRSTGGGTGTTDDVHRTVSPGERRAGGSFPERRDGFLEHHRRDDEPICEGADQHLLGDVPYKGFSEIPYARMVSERYGTIGHNLTINPSLIRTMPELVWHLDEPSDPLSVCMYHIAELARKEVKVVLGGDGGDELFGGYDRYYGNAYVSDYVLLPEFFRKQVMGKLLNHVSEGFWYRSFSHKLRWFHQLSFYDGAERYSKSLGYFYFANGRGNGLYTDSFERTSRGSTRRVVSRIASTATTQRNSWMNALRGHDDPDAGSPGDDPGPDDDGPRT